MNKLIGLLLVAGIAGCALETAEGDQRAEAQLGVSMQALSGSPVPTRLTLIDNTNDGVIQKVYMRNGLVLGANRRDRDGEGWVWNNGNATVLLTLNVDTRCEDGGHMARDFQVSLAPNASLRESTTCSGNASSVTTDFVNIDAAGTDIGYATTDAPMPAAISMIDTEYDGVIIEAHMVGINSNHPFVISANLRGTRAEARLENRSDTYYAYSSLRATAICGDGNSETTVTPAAFLIAPGETILLEARCRSGSATSAGAVFRR